MLARGPAELVELIRLDAPLALAQLVMPAVLTRELMNTITRPRTPYDDSDLRSEIWLWPDEHHQQCQRVGQGSVHREP